MYPALMALDISLKKSLTLSSKDVQYVGRLRVFKQSMNVPSWQESKYWFNRFQVSINFQACSPRLSNSLRGMEKKVFSLKLS